MKKIILFFTISLCNSALFAQANALNTQVQRQVYAAAQEATSRASIQFTWEKAVRISDVMMRRPRGADVVIQRDRATTTCSGVVSKENRVYFVSDCLAPGSFALEHLQKVQITFANGKQVVGGKNTVEKYKDVAWVTVHPGVLHGLPQLSVRHTPRGKSLQDVFGEAMTHKLKAFFQAHLIPAHFRYRIGRINHPSKAKVGDPVIIDGHLVALMKHIPLIYQDFLGGVSENSLAVIH